MIFTVRFILCFLFVYFRLFEAKPIETLDDRDPLNSRNATKESKKVINEELASLARYAIRLMNSIVQGKTKSERDTRIRIEARNETIRFPRSEDNSTSTNRSDSIVPGDDEEATKILVEKDSSGNKSNSSNGSATSDLEPVIVVPLETLASVTRETREPSGTTKLNALPVKMQVWLGDEPPYFATVFSIAGPEIRNSTIRGRDVRPDRRLKVVERFPSTTETPRSREKIKVSGTTTSTEILRDILERLRAMRRESENKNSEETRFTTEMTKTASKGEKIIEKPAKKKQNSVNAKKRPKSRITSRKSVKNEKNKKKSASTTLLKSSESRKTTRLTRQNDEEYGEPEGFVNEVEGNPELYEREYLNLVETGEEIGENEVEKTKEDAYEIKIERNKEQDEKPKETEKVNEVEKKKTVESEEVNEENKTVANEGANQVEEKTVKDEKVNELEEEKTVENENTSEVQDERADVEEVDEERVVDEKLAKPKEVVSEKQQADDEDDDEEDDNDEEGGILEPFIQFLPIIISVVEDVLDPKSDTSLQQVLEVVVPLIRDILDGENEDGTKVDIVATLSPIAANLIGPNGMGLGLALQTLLPILGPLIGPLIGPLLGPLIQGTFDPGSENGSSIQPLLQTVVGTLSKPTEPGGISPAASLVSGVIASLSKELGKGHTGGSDIGAVIGTVVSGLIAGTSAGSKQVIKSHPKFSKTTPRPYHDPTQGLMQAGSVNTYELVGTSAKGIYGITREIFSTFLGKVTDILGLTTPTARVGPPSGFAYVHV